MENNTEDIIDDKSDDEIVINDESPNDDISINESLNTKNIKDNQHTEPALVKPTTSQTKQNTNPTHNIRPYSDENVTDIHDELINTSQLILADKGVFDNNTKDNKKKEINILIDGAIEDKYWNSIYALKREMTDWKEKYSMLSSEMMRKRGEENKKQKAERDSNDALIKENEKWKNEIDELVKQLNAHKTREKENMNSINEATAANESSKINQRNEEDVQEITKWNENWKWMTTRTDVLQKQWNESKKEVSKLREEMLDKNKTISDLQQKLIKLEQESFENENLKWRVNHDLHGGQSYHKWVEQYREEHKQFNHSISENQKITEENEDVKWNHVMNTPNNVTHLAPSSPNNINTNTNANDPNWEHYEIKTQINRPYSRATNHTSESIWKPNERAVIGANDNIITNSFDITSHEQTAKNTQKQKISRRKLIQPKSEINIKHSQQGNTFSSFTVFPGQKEMILKESRILEIETQWYKWQKERDSINDEFLKFPEFPKQKIQIHKKKEWEITIQSIDTRINKHKLQWRELNS